MTPDLENAIGVLIDLLDEYARHDVTRVCNWCGGTEHHRGCEIEEAIKDAEVCLTVDKLRGDAGGT